MLEEAMRKRMLRLRDVDSAMLDRLHSRTEAAEALNISLRSLDRLLKDGKLAVTKIGGRRLLRASEIARLIDESTATAGGDG